MPKIKVKDKNVLQRIKVTKSGKHAAPYDTRACLCKSKQVGDVYHYHASDGDDCNDIIIMMLLVTMTMAIADASTENQEVSVRHKR